MASPSSKSVSSTPSAVSHDAFIKSTRIVRGKGLKGKIFTFLVTCGVSEKYMPDYVKNAFSQINTYCADSSKEMPHDIKKENKNLNKVHEKLQKHFKNTKHTNLKTLIESTDQLLLTYHLKTIIAEQIQEKMKEEYFGQTPGPETYLLRTFEGMLNPDKSGDIAFDTILVDKWSDIETFLNPDKKMFNTEKLQKAGIPLIFHERLNSLIPEITTKRLEKMNKLCTSLKEEQKLQKKLNDNRCENVAEKFATRFLNCAQKANPSYVPTPSSSAREAIQQHFNVIVAYATQTSALDGTILTSAHNIVSSLNMELESLEKQTAAIREGYTELGGKIQNNSYVSDEVDAFLKPKLEEVAKILVPNYDAHSKQRDDLWKFLIEQLERKDQPVNLEALNKIKQALDAANYDFQILEVSGKLKEYAVTLNTNALSANTLEEAVTKIQKIPKKKISTLKNSQRFKENGQMLLAAINQKAKTQELDLETIKKLNNALIELDKCGLDTSNTKQILHLLEIASLFSQDQRNIWQYAEPFNSALTACQISLDDTLFNELLNDNPLLKKAKEAYKTKIQIISGTESMTKSIDMTRAEKPSPSLESCISEERSLRDRETLLRSWYSYIPDIDAAADTLWRSRKKIAVNNQMVRLANDAANTKAYQVALICQAIYIQVKPKKPTFPDEQLKQMIADAVCLHSLEYNPSNTIYTNLFELGIKLGHPEILLQRVETTPRDETTPDYWYTFDGKTLTCTIPATYAFTIVDGDAEKTLSRVTITSTTVKTIGGDPKWHASITVEKKPP